MAGKARADLSDRERTFVREYLIDMNALQAGIRAGYAPKQVGSNIYRVLRRRLRWPWRSGSRTCGSMRAR